MTTKDEARAKALRSVHQWAASICDIEDMEADIDAYAAAAVKEALPALQAVAAICAAEAALADTLGLMEGLLTSGAATQVDLYLGDCPGVQQITVDRLEDGTFRYWKARADQLQDDGTPCTRDEAQALLAGEEKKG